METKSTALVVSIVFSTLLSSYAGAAGFSKQDKEEKFSEEKFSRVFFIKAGDDVSYSIGAPDELSVQANEASVANYCGVSAMQGAAISPVLTAILGPLVKSGINIALDSINEKLKAELAKYTAEYSSTAWLGSSELKDVKCLRFVRGTTLETGERIDLDFVAGVIRKQGREGVRVEPLRIYFSKPAPINPSSDGNYGVALSMTITGVNAAGRKELGKVAVLSDKFGPNEKGESVDSHVRYYLGKPSDKVCADSKRANKDPVRCKDLQAGEYIPFSKSSAGSEQVVGVAIGAAEVGTPSRHLKTFQKIFEGAKGDIGSGLADIAKEKLGLADDD